MTDTDASSAISRFLALRRDRPRWGEVPSNLRPHGIKGGYRLQKSVHEALDRAGIRRLGYKIASTTKAGQAFFGIEEPIYAGIFTDTQARSLSDALSLDLVDPAVECEVAFRLGVDLDGAGGGNAILDAIESCHLACEVIDRRYGDALALGVPALIVDDFFHAAFVLGPANSRWHDIDLADLTGHLEIDGVVVNGHSRDVVDPITALNWLAGALARSGQILRAGEIVLTGSLVVPTPVRLPAKSVSLWIDGFEPLSTLEPD